MTAIQPIYIFGALFAGLIFNMIVCMHAAAKKSSEDAMRAELAAAWKNAKGWEQKDAALGKARLLEQAGYRIGPFWCDGKGKEIKRKARELRQKALEQRGAF